MLDKTRSPATLSAMPAVASAADEPPQPVNREAVKVLAQAVGIREAARRMGLSEERVLKWSQRDPAGPWGTAPAARERQAISLSSNCPQPVVSASDAFAEIMAERRENTRLGLSEYTVRASSRAAQLPDDQLLAEAPAVKAVADIAGKVWPEQPLAVGVQVNIGRGIVE